MECVKVEAGAVIQKFTDGIEILRIEEIIDARRVSKYFVNIIVVKKWSHGDAVYRLAAEDTLQPFPARQILLLLRVVSNP